VAKEALIEATSREDKGVKISAKTSLPGNGLRLDNEGSSQKSGPAGRGTKGERTRFSTFREGRKKAKLTGGTACRKTKRERKKRM